MYIHRMGICERNNVRIKIGSTCTLARSHPNQTRQAGTEGKKCSRPLGSILIGPTSPTASSLVCPSFYPAWPFATAEYPPS